MGWSLVQRSPNDCGVSDCDCEASVKRWLWPTAGLLHRVGGGGKYKLRSSFFSIIPHYFLKLSVLRFEKGRYCYFPRHQEYLLLRVLWRTASSAMWPLAFWGTLMSVPEQHTASLFQDTTVFFLPLICVLPVVGTAKFHTHITRIAINNLMFFRPCIIV